MASIIAVSHSALEQDRQGFKASVRMVWKTSNGVVGVIASEVIEHQKRIQSLLEGLSDDASQANARAVLGFPTRQRCLKFSHFNVRHL